MLESEPRLLHADRRQQDEMRDTGRLRRFQRIHMRGIVDGPCVFRHAGARGEAGDECVETLATKAVAGQRCRIGRHADANLGAR